MEFCVLLRDTSLIFLSLSEVPVTIQVHVSSWHIASMQTLVTQC